MNGEMVTAPVVGAWVVRVEPLPSWRREEGADCPLYSGHPDTVGMVADDGKFRGEACRDDHEHWSHLGVYRVSEVSS